MAKKTAEQKALEKAKKAQVTQTKSAQRAEIKALKQSGADKAIIKSETKANKQELKDLNTALKTGTYTPLTDLSGIRSQAATYSGDLATQVGGLLDSAASYYTQYNIPTVSTQSGATIGVGLDHLLDYNLGKGGKSIVRLMDNAKSYVGQTVTADQLASSKVKVKEDKNNPGVFVAKSGGDTKTYTYFTKNEDGTFTGVGVNRLALPPQDSGFFGSTLGKIALGVGGFFLGPAVGSLIGLGSGVVGSTVGGSLLGGTATKLTGGDFKTGALIGGSGGFAGGGGLSAIPGVSEITSNLPSITDIPGVSNITNALPSVKDIPVIGDVYKGVEGLFGPQPIPFSDALAEAEFLAADATQLAQQGLSNTAIQQNLVMSGVDPALAASAADQAVMGIGERAIASDMAGFGFGKGGTLYPGVTTGPLTGISTVGGGLFSGIKSLFPSTPGLTSLGNLGTYMGNQFIQQALADQQAQQQQAGGYAGAAPDYSGLIRLLSAPSARLSLV